MAKRKSVPLENWLTTAQVAEQLGITQRHVQELCVSGGLECRKIAPRLILVNPQSVAEWRPKRRRRKDKPIE